MDSASDSEPEYDQVYVDPDDYESDESDLDVTPPRVVSPIYAVTPPREVDPSTDMTPVDTRWPYMHGRNDWRDNIFDHQLTNILHAFTRIQNPTRRQINKFVRLINSYQIGATVEIVEQILGQYGPKISRRTSLTLLELIINTKRGITKNVGYFSIIMPLHDPIIFSMDSARYIVRDLYSCEFRGDFLNLITHDTTPGFLANGNFSLRLSIAPKLVNIIEINRIEDTQVDRYNVFPFEISSLWSVLSKSNKDRNTPGNVNSILVALGKEELNIPEQCISVPKMSMMQDWKFKKFARRYVYGDAVRKIEGNTMVKTKFVDVLSSEITNVGIIQLGKNLFLKLSTAGLIASNRYDEYTSGNYILISIEQYGDYFVPANINVNEFRCTSLSVFQYCGNFISAESFVKRFGNFPRLEKEKKLKNPREISDRERNRFLPCRK